MFDNLYQVLKRWFPVSIRPFVLLALCGALAACQSPTPTPEPLSRSNFEGKKIIWIDSYHEGNSWNDGIGKGIQEILKDTEIEFEIVRMDTARNTSEEFKQEAALQAKAAIEAFNPDVIIASDDNAQKYLIVPYIMETGLPVVFCGVNWDASSYGYPTENVTGMIEVDLVESLINAMREHAQGERVGYLSGDTETQLKVTQNYNERFFDGKMEVRLVKTFEEFKEEFLRLQDQVDMLITGNYVGIENWDETAAQEFITNNTKIPTGYVDGYMMPFVLITMGKIPEEQGRYSAEVALKILDGASPSEFVVTSNKEASLSINLKIAEKMDIVFSPSILKNADTIYGEE